MEFVRNIPLVLIAFIFYFALPVIGITLNGFVAGTVTLTVYTALYCRSNSRWYFISCERANGSRSLFRANVCAGDVLCCLTTSCENCNSPLGNQFLNLVKTPQYLESLLVLI